MMPAVVVVDPISTGAAVAERLAERNVKVIRLWGNEVPEELKRHVPKNQRADLYAATMEHEGTVDAASLAKTASRLRALPFRITDIICGGEPGVTLTNALAEYMGLRSNSTVFAEARNNKYHQSEAVRQSGLRAVEQVLVSSEAPVHDFLVKLAPSPFRIIVKPVASAGSEDVKLCRSEQEVIEHVRYVLGKDFNALGRRNDAVLVQEYLRGTEYIVDFVSRDGVHKCVAVWEYDKRQANGGSAVYFGERPMGSGSELEKRLMQYTSAVLDAVGITNGATHSECIVDATGEPCLVECNCRANGGDGLWLPLAEGLYGYSQVSALIDAYLDGASFQRLPFEPPVLRRRGVVGHIVSYQEGTMLSAPGLEQLKALPSHIGTALCLNEGDELSKTIDFLTDAGVFLLLNDDPELLEADYERAHALTARGDFFVVAGFSHGLTKSDSAGTVCTNAGTSDDDSTNESSPGSPFRE